MYFNDPISSDLNVKLESLINRSAVVKQQDHLLMCSDLVLSDFFSKKRQLGTIFSKNPQNSTGVAPLLKQSSSSVSCLPSGKG
jgi:hypothetical protein